MHFAGSVHADGVRHFNVTRSGGTGNEDCRFGFARQRERVLERRQDVRGSQDRDMNFSKERSLQGIPFAIPDQNRPGICQPANGLCHTDA